ncbi:hypothetical protein AMK59_6224 [Oryctes borbonicus]|uniref:EF-hand domain-containing protein n=1 Tax=Oryctes borbonicus TaxID=1629725 RepID=A0A0T6B1G5_9SCAR|nr:hypothetical protein AMK59_6224 [Oryctes borbonicus]
MKISYCQCLLFLIVMEVYNAICGRLGSTLHIPGDSLQELFNDMHLYPSKPQVTEMLQCARQCSRRNGTYLTFGEFCLFARELQNGKIRKTSQKQKKCSGKCEVFLGGSCNPTTWRTDTAIPELQKHGITYYNPQVSMWAPELVAEEHDAKQSASVLLYVIDSQTRSVGGMIEVAYLVATGRCVVLVACPYKFGQTIMGEAITKQECIDLITGQASLLALVKSRGIKVHGNLSSAIQCTANLLKSSSLNNGMTAEELITYKLRKLRQTFDLYDPKGTGELTLEGVMNAYYTLTNRSMVIYDLYRYLSTSNQPDLSQIRITFEQFCVLVAEFSTDGCENVLSDEWVSIPLQRQCSRNNNSHCDDVNKHENCGNVPLSSVDAHNNYTMENGNDDSCDIYLGGSCHSSNAWREQAISLIKKRGLRYYNPAIREGECFEFDGDDVERYLSKMVGYYYSNTGGDDVNDSSAQVNESKLLGWKRTMDNSKVLLFVITEDTRSLTTMILAAYYIGLGKDVVLCVQHLSEEESIVRNEKLTKQATKDYNRGRVYLSDLAKRKQVSVFDNITKAVQRAIDLCYGNR